jgi:hypothetical protein
MHVPRHRLVTSRVLSELRATCHDAHRVDEEGGRCGSLTRYLLYSTVIIYGLLLSE